MTLPLDFILIQSGERAATGDAGWRAGAWYEQTHKQTQKDEQTQHNSNVDADRFRQGGSVGADGPPVGRKGGLRPVWGEGVGDAPFV